jgi:hypothetical protein
MHQSRILAGTFHSVRGGRAEIVVGAGNDGVLTYEMEATKARRRQKVSVSRGVIEVELVKAGAGVTVPAEFS